MLSGALGKGHIYLHPYNLPVPEIYIPFSPWEETDFNAN